MDSRMMLVADRPIKDYEVDLVRILTELEDKPIRGMALVALFEDNDSDEAGVDYYYNMSLMDKQAAAGLIESDVIYQIARDAAMDAAEERSEEQ